MADAADDIARWRAQAADLRSLASRFKTPGARDRLRQAAEAYEARADAAEAEQQSVASRA